MNPVIVGIVHGPVEGAVQPEYAQCPVILIFVARVFRNLDDHANDLGTFRTRVYFVQQRRHRSQVSARAPGVVASTTRNGVFRKARYRSPSKQAKLSPARSRWP